jgi:site-specific recombinase XerD
MELGVDISIIQALMGHRYLRSTTHYVHVSTQRIQNIESPLDCLGTFRGSVLG